MSAAASQPQVVVVTSATSAKPRRSPVSATTSTHTPFGQAVSHLAIGRESRSYGLTGLRFCQPYYSLAKRGTCSQSSSLRHDPVLTK